MNPIHSRAWLRVGARRIPENLNYGSAKRIIYSGNADDSRPNIPKSKRGTLGKGSPFSRLYSVSSKIDSIPSDSYNIDMPPLSTECEIKFDYSVSTEDRFAVRRWFQALVDSQNKSDLSLFIDSCAEDLIAEGFAEAALTKAELVKFMKQVHAGKQVLMRYPKLAIGYNRYLYTMEGDLEMYVNGILSMDGTFESRVRRDEETNKFQFVWIKFYPRMIVSL